MVNNLQALLPNYIHLEKKNLFNYLLQYILYGMASRTKIFWMFYYYEAFDSVLVWGEVEILRLFSWIY